MFLTWYSPEAIAAAMPAGILNFAITCVFIGIASYAGTFVALYSVFDSKNIIFASAIKGAGDTRFVMFMIVEFRNEDYLWMPDSQ